MVKAGARCLLQDPFALCQWWQLRMLEAWSRVQTLLLLLLLLVEWILWNEVYVGSGSELLRGEVRVL